MSVTMLNVDGKIFWVLNVVSLFPQCLITSFYCKFSNINFKSRYTPMIVGLDTSLAFMYFLESLLQGMDTLYNQSGGGKIFANIFGLLMMVVYFYCFNESFAAY